ncbi:MAG: ABC transporter substrate-binding protein [Acidiferrobacterales bacterium]
MSPAISRTLVDFGLEDRIVGRSAFCRSIDPSIPVVGDLHTVNYEQLIRLAPTHILVQPPSTGLDPKLVELAAKRAWVLGQWPRLNGVNDIERLIRQLPTVLYSDGSDAHKRAAMRAARLLEEIAAALSPGSEPMFGGGTLLLAGLEPVTVFGRETYLHDILMRFGGKNATDTTGWAQLSLEDVVRISPEALVLVLADDPDKAPKPTDALGSFDTLDIPAVRHGRLAVLAHPDSMLPSSGVIGVAHAMRAVLRQLTQVSE